MRANIETYMELLQAEILSVIPSEGERSILSIAIEETHAQASADCAVQEVLAALLPDGSAPLVLLEHAERECVVHEGKLRRCRTMLGSLLRNGAPQRMRAHA